MEGESNMEDSIERIREDARKHYTDYWGCEGRRCDECRANGAHEDCVTAKYIDLLNRAMRLMDERQLPEGVEWPRFEDGELVGFGDYYVGCDGVAHEVKGIFVYGDEQPLIMYVSDGVEPITVMPGERVKRPEPADTQEKIDADAEKSFCEYFGHGSGICKEGGVCEAHGSSEPCRALMIRDLLRRQRELCERGAR